MSPNPAVAAPAASEIRTQSSQDQDSKLLDLRTQTSELEGRTQNLDHLARMGFLATSASEHLVEHLSRSQLAAAADFFTVVKQQVLVGMWKLGLTATAAGSGGGGGGCPMISLGRSGVTGPGVVVEGSEETAAAAGGGGGGGGCTMRREVVGAVVADNGGCGEGVAVGVSDSAWGDGDKVRRVGEGSGDGEVPSRSWAAPPEGPGAGKAAGFGADGSGAGKAAGAKAAAGVKGGCSDLDCTDDVGKLSERHHTAAAGSGSSGGSSLRSGTGRQGSRAEPTLVLKEEDVTAAAAGGWSGFKLSWRGFQGPGVEAGYVVFKAHHLKRVDWVNRGLNLGLLPPFWLYRHLQMVGWRLWPMQPVFGEWTNLVPPYRVLLQTITFQPLRTACSKYMHAH
jgi:hypothetical protein